MRNRFLTCMAAATAFAFTLSTPITSTTAFAFDEADAIEDDEADIYDASDEDFEDTGIRVTFDANGGTFSNGDDENTVVAEDYLVEENSFHSKNLDDNGFQDSGLKRISDNKSITIAEDKKGYNTLCHTFDLTYQIGHIYGAELYAGDKSILTMDGGQEQLSWAGSSKKELKIKLSSSKYASSKEDEDDGNYGYYGIVASSYVKGIQEGAYETPTNDGKVFTGWEMDGSTWDGSAGTVYATWGDEPDPIVPYDELSDQIVSYQFVSISEGAALPSEILSMLPENEMHTEEDTVYPSFPITDTYETAEGIWTFAGYDMDSLVVSSDPASNVFTGSWSYSPKTFPVSYRFISGSGEELPAEVLSMLPSSYEAVVGSTANAVPPAEITVETSDGVWSFNGYDLPSLVVSNQAEENLFTGTWVFSASAKTGSVTYQFESLDPSVTLPAEVNSLLPEAEVKDAGSSVTPSYPEMGMIIQDDANDGEWKFEGYTPETITVAADTDNSFIGRWSFSKNVLYSVTYKAISDTPDMSLPDESVSWIPSDASSYKKGSLVNAIKPETETHTTADGKWTFVGYDKETLTINGEDDVFTAKYIFTKNAAKTSTVSYVYASGTTGKSLPDSIKAPENVELEVGTKVSPKIAIGTSIEADGGKWTLTKWSPETITVVEGSNTFTGTWTFTENPKETSTVSYSFVSGTANTSLPNEVMALLPKDTTTYEVGSTVSPKSPSVTSVKVSNGTWAFAGYDKTSLTVANSANTFTGSWLFTSAETEKPDDDKSIVYTIRYCLMKVSGKEYSVKERSIISAETVPTPEIKTYEGFTYQKYTIADNPKGGKYLNVLYSRDKHSLSYGESKNGSEGGSKPGTYYYGATINVKYTPSKGYDFDQWKLSTKVKWGNGKSSETSSNANDAFAMPASDVKVTPSVKLHNYTITYNLDGGKAANGSPTQYTIESEAFSLKPPTKSGYTFAGWTGSNGNKQQLNVTIGKGTAANLTFTAHWVEGTTNTTRQTGNNSQSTSSGSTSADPGTTAPSTTAGSGSGSNASSGNGGTTETETEIMTETDAEGKVVNRKVVTKNKDGVVLDNVSTGDETPLYSLLFAFLSSLVILVFTGLGQKSTRD